MYSSFIRSFFVALSAITLLNSCFDSYKVIDSNSRNEVVIVELSTSDSLYSFINPYKLVLEERMNEVLCESLIDLEIGIPEGLLGDFIADITLSISRSKSDQSIDFCLLNNGGLRVPIMKGEVTRGLIYELMPFENELVILELNGEQMNNLIAHVAEKSRNSSSPKSGVPVSGIRISMTGTKVSEVMIGTKIYDPNKNYTVVTSDYLAEGGDNMDFFLNPIKTTPVNIKLRDAIIQYVQNLGKQGIKINAQLDGRIYISE